MTQELVEMNDKANKEILVLHEIQISTNVDDVMALLQKPEEAISLQISMTCGFVKIKLPRFESRSFEDFTWRTLFSKTLPASDFALVAPANHRVCSVPWHTMHM